MENAGERANKKSTQLNQMTNLRHAKLFVYYFASEVEKWLRCIVLRVVCSLPIQIEIQISIPRNPISHQIELRQTCKSDTTNEFDTIAINENTSVLLNITYFFWKKTFSLIELQIHGEKNKQNR